LLQKILEPSVEEGVIPILLNNDLARGREEFINNLSVPTSSSK